MVRAYSADLRERVVQVIEEGTSAREAARHFRVSPSFAVKLMARRRGHGSSAPLARGRPSGNGKLAGEHAYLMARLAEQPDLTMTDLARRLWQDRGVRAHPASVSRFLCRAGITFKKRR